MTLLFDQLRSIGYKMPTAQNTDDAVSKIWTVAHTDGAVYLADNCARFYYDESGRDALSKDWRITRDFPDMTPPAPAFFIEFSPPQGKSRPAQAGVLFMMHDLWKVDRIAEEAASPEQRHSGPSKPSWQCWQSSRQWMTSQLGGTCSVRRCLVRNRIL